MRGDWGMAGALVAPWNRQIEGGLRYGMCCGRPQKLTDWAGIGVRHVLWSPPEADRLSRDWGTARAVVAPRSWQIEPGLGYGTCCGRPQKLTDWAGIGVRHVLWSPPEADRLSRDWGTARAVVAPRSWQIEPGLGYGTCCGRPQKLTDWAGIGVRHVLWSPLEADRLRGDKIYFWSMQNCNDFDYSNIISTFGHRLQHYPNI